MKSVKYLLNLSEMTGLNDTQLAKEIGITQAAISQYKSGKRIMNDESCLAVANLLNVDPMLVVAAACIDRAEKTGQKSLWEDFLMSRMATACALLFFACVTNFLTLPKAEAAPVSAYSHSEMPNSLYYVKLLLGNISKKLGTVLAWFERLFISVALEATTA